MRPEPTRNCHKDSCHHAEWFQIRTIFDGYSIVTGHEYAEAVTDPDNIASWQDGWLDAQGSENGDKCAWLNTQNIALASHQFAVQPLWSNEAFDATGNGCVVSR